MKQKSGPDKAPAEQVVKDIRRQTRRQYSAEEKIRIVLEGLRGEENISELCRREGIAASMYYGWSKEFLEAGKRRLAGDTARAATSGEVKDLRREAAALKEVAADLTLENRLLKNEIEAAVPRELDVHLVMDNYVTHKTPLIRRWLAKRPRWHVHLTPTGSSWLNQIERFFALLTDKTIRRGIYRSVAALRADITSFIDRHNADPKPFRWTKSADDILASIERFCRYNAPAKHDVVLRTSGSGH